MVNALANLSNRAVIAILIGIAILSSAASLVVNLAFQVDLSAGWWVSWLQNFSTEMFGAFLTFVLIELIVGGRERRTQQKHEQLDYLLHQLCSSNAHEASHALDELREIGWLRDGSLKGKYLGHAELENANLERADLHNVCLELAKLPGANLKAANLQNANLRHASLNGARLTSALLQSANLANADLRDSYLEGANFQSAHMGFAQMQNAQLVIAQLPQAYLEGVNLEQANLSFANLQGAHLEGAALARAKMQGVELQGASLSMADLQGADLSRAKFDETTILPDQSRWTTDTDLSRFTDLSHPNFWRSDNPCSPAYHYLSGRQVLP
ncbi:MAG: pentapeptide repeat-containing protein [bacterium]|nr:pentapeptide repeat-containing protein [bacterium]